MSFEFDIGLTASQIPDVISAIRYAHRKGVVLVAAAGNTEDTRVAYPARARNVIAVGATTEHGCLAEYSNTGSGLDLVAPGGGADAVDRGRPQLPSARGARAATSTSTRSRGDEPAQLRPAGRIRGHVDGGSARVGHGRADARREACSARNPSPEAITQRLSSDRARPRHPGLRLDSTAGACSTRPPPRASASARPASAQVVRTISTEQGAWCDTLFGTLPSRKRLAPVMPLLPTTIRSAFCSSATSRIASAGSPWRAKVLHLDPGRLDRLRPPRRASRRRPRWGRPCGRCRPAPPAAPRAAESAEPARRRSRASARRRSAWRARPPPGPPRCAVSEPSVPTTMRVNILPSSWGTEWTCGAAADAVAEVATHTFERPMQRQPMPGFWIAVQVAIVICVLISAVIVIVKL